MRTEKKVKLKDIADALNVSIVSVSNALCDKKGVSPELRKAIHKKAEEMGYETLHVPEAEKPRQYTIGVLISSEDIQSKDQAFTDIVGFYRENIEKVGSRYVIQELPSFHEILSRAYKPFSGQKIDGILINGDIEPVYLKELKRKMNCPVVCTGYYDASSDIDFIITDDFHGMEILTEYVIDLGFRDLRFVGAPRDDRRVMDRYLGFCCALEKRGVEELRGKSTPVFDGTNWITKLDIPKKLPEIFMCCSNKAAIILIKQLEDEGIRVPGDVSVTGFGFLNNIMNNGRTLTTYDFSHVLYAKDAVNTIINRIANRTRPHNITMISGYIVEGDTLNMRKRQ